MKSHQTLLTLVIILCAAACKKESPPVSVNSSITQQDVQSPQCKTCPTIDPSDFVKGIDNPYLPFVPGTTLHYLNKSVDGGQVSTEHDNVTVTSDTRFILGVACTVVHDEVTVK